MKIALFLYELNFSGKFSHITEIPDYNLRAEKLAEFIQTDDQSFLKNFQSQIQVLNVAKEKITQVGSALYKEIKKINQSYNLIQNTYYALGGSGKQQKDLIFEALQLMGKGMIGIFVALNIIMIFVWIMAILGKKKD